MNKTYTVRLTNGTIGTIDGDTLAGQNAEDFIGENVTVQLHDENGNNIEAYGKLEEVIETS